MFTKAEKKQLRLEFWNHFNQISEKKRLKSRKPASWIMNSTGIRQLKLKFEFDEKIAAVGIDIETRNKDKRIELYKKLESLRSNFETALGKNLKWEPDHVLPSGKIVSSICLEIRNVNIYRKDDWKEVSCFFYDHMIIFEEIFTEYKDYFKYSKSAT